MLAKLIVWAPDRAGAIERMRRALGELVIVGVGTNQGFHERLMQDPAYCRGEVDIQFLDRRPDLAVAAELGGNLGVVVAAALAEEGARRAGKPSVAPDGNGGSEWTRLALRDGLR